MCSMESETINRSVNVNVNVDDNIHNQIANDPQEPPSVNNEDSEVQKETKKAKTTTSEVWNYFSKVGVKDGKEKAKCNACGQEYVIGLTRFLTRPVVSQPV